MKRIRCYCLCNQSTFSTTGRYVSYSFPRFVTSLVYYGVSLNVGNFGVDVYLTQLIFGIAEIPARLGSLPLIDYFGRRLCQAAALFFGGTACLVILAIPKGNMMKSSPFSPLRPEADSKNNLLNP